MNIKPVAGPLQIQQSPVNHKAQADAKARAVAMMTGQQPQNNEHPVQNPSNISVEELTALKPSGQNREDVTQAPMVTEETQVPKPEITEQSASSTMAALARREKAIRAKAQQQQEQFKTREAQLAAREAAIAEKEAKTQVDLSQYIPRSQLKDATVETLEAEGLSYDEITQQFVNRQPRNPRYEAFIDKQNQQIAKLQEKLESFEKNQVESQAQSYNAALKQIERDTQSLVSSEPETYELIKSTGSVRDVVELIEQTYKEENRLMTVEEAAQEVEEYLADEAWKLAQTKKIKSRYSNSSATNSNTGKQPPSPNQQQQPMKTLTNSVGSTRKLTSVERAKLAFEGKLK